MRNIPSSGNMRAAFANPDSASALIDRLCPGYTPPDKCPGMFVVVKRANLIAKEANRAGMRSQRWLLECLTASAASREPVVRCPPLLDGRLDDVGLFDVRRLWVPPWSRLNISLIRRLGPMYSTPNLGIRSCCEFFERNRARMESSTRAMSPDATTTLNMTLVCGLLS